MKYARERFQEHPFRHRWRVPRWLTTALPRHRANTVPVSNRTLDCPSSSAGDFEPNLMQREHCTVRRFGQIIQAAREPQIPRGPGTSFAATPPRPRTHGYDRGPLKTRGAQRGHHRHELFCHPRQGTDLRGCLHKSHRDHEGHRRS